MRILSLCLRVASLLILLLQTAAAQPRYLRGLERNTATQKWEFFSMDLSAGQSSTVAVLPDTLIPWGNGTATAFNPLTQQYYYLAETPAPATRYLVTLDAFSGRVLQAVATPGVFAIYANELDGFLYGIRFITVTQLVRVSPTTGTVTALTANFNFVFAYSAAGSDLHAQNNELWIVGQQPQNTDRLLRLNLTTLAVPSITAPGLRLVRRNYQTGEAYGVKRALPSSKFTLFTIDPADPSQQTVLEDSLPIQAISGEVAQLNPHLGELYLRVLQTGNPVAQLAVIGLDDGQIRGFIPFANKNGIAYTPFPPNLRTHTLSGIVYLDRNANGQRDSADIGMTNQRIDVQPGGYRVLTNAAGRYAVQVPDGTYTVTPFPSSLYYVASQPASYSVPLLSGFGMADTLDFALAIFAGSAPQDQVNVSISPSPGRVGRDAQHTITIKNDGNTVLDGTVTYDEGEHMTVSNTSEPPSSVNNGRYEFQFSNLLPGESRQITITLSTPPDPSLIGDYNTATARVDAQSPGGGSASDVETVTQNILAAYDPNDKLVFMVTDTTRSAGDTLIYRIRFQNVGNDTAFLVVIRDTLPISQLNLESFTMDAASHRYFIQIEPDGHVAWTFPDILLPDSATDQLGSNGFVEFRIALKGTLPPGTVIRNRADIYFDFNPPVRTNNATVRLPGASALAADLIPGLALYPNPVRGQLFVSALGALAPPQLFGLDGRPLPAPVQRTSGGFSIGTEAILPGMYLLFVQPAAGGPGAWLRWVKQ